MSRYYESNPEWEDDCEENDEEDDCFDCDDEPTEDEQGMYDCRVMNDMGL